MLAGIAAYIKAVQPNVRVVGVEHAGAPGMSRSIEAGARVRLEQMGLFAASAAVALVGEETFRICSAAVDEMIVVSTEEVCAAIKDAFNDCNVVLEPAGALAIAGMKKYVEDDINLNMDAFVTDQRCTFVAITSGANIEFDRLRFIAERADSQEALISVVIPERPGAFRELYQQIYPRNVTEFSYRMGDSTRANIMMSFQARSLGDTEEVLNTLKASGFDVIDLRENEVAKTHTRYLAGGRAQHASDERLFRFEFPERPGALNTFLDHLDGGFNVSLFHYRNVGADVGHVLVGLQVPKESSEVFQAFLEGLGYPFVEETGNASYEQFLR